MDPVDLESFVDKKLNALPVPRAPQTLLPRVLLAVREWAERPWYARAWVTWPAGWQLASAAALAILVAGLAWVWTSALPSAIALSTVAERTREIIYFAERLQLTTHAGHVLWRAVVEPIARSVLVVLLLLCLVCVAFGTVLNRVALGRA